MKLVRIGCLASMLAACTSFGAVYPPRPPASPGPTDSDPAPSRVVAHITVTRQGLRDAVDDAVPRQDEGSFDLLKTKRKYTWKRSNFDVSFSQGRIVLETHVDATVDMVTSIDAPLDIKVIAEPVISSEYKVKLQSTEVKVTSTDRRVKTVDKLASIFDTIGSEIHAKLKSFSYDAKPPMEEAYARLTKPIDIPLGDAKACAWLKVIGVEAGPTIVADGLEKDVALVVAPQVSVPCGAPDTVAPLPAFANVAQVPSGPFTVTIPIAARWDELQKAMGMLFTDGKYFFSPEFPKLYLENPEVYESQGQIVLKVHIKGPVHKFGIDADLDGDLFLSGHLRVVDNEVQIPDLEPTIETKSFLLSLKAVAEGDKIRDQARQALRLDLGERLRSVKEKVSSELTFGTGATCFKADLDKVELTSANPHGSYLRVYVAVTAHAGATMPCAAGPPLPPPTPAGAK
ncbi:MAG: DUF4403 family protein [Labilithrix sp.]